MSDNSNTPAGWYPDTRPGAPAGAEMYWDGSAWQTNMTRAAGTPATVSTPVVEEPAAKKPWYKRKPIIIPVGIVAGLVLISGIANAANGGGDDVADAKPAVTRSAEPVVEEEEEPEPEPVYVTVPNVVGISGNDAKAAVEALGLKLKVEGPESDMAQPVGAQHVNPDSQLKEGDTLIIALVEKPKLTLAQENVIRQAQSYLRVSGFSRTGLIDQLLYEGYSQEDATFGADNAGADWNQEAAESATSYLNVSSFSRQGLYDQLAYEGFTDAEIQFGLAAVGY